ncbi:RDD family protein [Advenella alkanexedens]|uniref:RDD family protein n=1 Tax=Advenella alkanexedens TaxID=1481665 RepID=UPI002676672E|nr:RDD family protein [Advenella alkanexedens]WKU20637.1 RDD family protein [Advenella alkanexedens]
MTYPARLRIFACMMYEGVLLFGLVFFASYIFDTLTQSRHGLMYHAPRQALLFVVIGLYFITSWKRKGQTLPMKTWNILLCDKSGNKPGTGQLILRYLLCWPIPLLGAAGIYWLSQSLGWASITMFIIVTPFLNFVYSWFDRDGLMLHDRWAGTRLINIAGKRS